jgi:hypothetical protein
MRSWSSLLGGVFGVTLLVGCGGGAARGLDEPDASVPAAPPPGATRVAGALAPDATLARFGAHPGLALALRDARRLERVAGGYHVVADAGGSAQGGWRRATPKLELTIPSSAERTMRVQIAGDANAYVELHGEGLDAVEAHLDERAVVYANAARETDVVHLASESRFEELRVMHDARAAGSHRWSVRLGPAFASVRVSKTGAIEVLDAAGAVRMETEPVVAIDAKGVRRTLEVRATAGADATTTIVATLDTADLAWPVVVDPAWTATASMSGVRNDPAAGLLPNGTVIVAGGYAGAGTATALSTAEVFTPATGTWTSIKSMVLPHAGARGFTLAGASTRFLVADVETGQSELWDGTNWTSYPMLRAHPLSKPVLMGGTVNKVLAVGGYDGVGFLSAAEVFDGTGWKAVAPCPASRYLQTLGWLPNLGTTGKLVSGGGIDSTAEFYDPATNAWSAAPAMPAQDIYHQPAVTMQNGKVLSIGPHVTTVFDGTTWTSVIEYGTHQNRPAVALTGGKVLTPPDLFDPALVNFVSVGLMVQPRVNEALVALADGRAVAAGGVADASSTLLGSAEIFAFMPNGSACTLAYDCASGICADGVCCATACPSQCQACDVAGSLGTCTNVTGTPHNTKTCSGYLCTGVAAACPTSCASDANCAGGFWCKANQCVAKSTNGATCPSGAHECSSNNCVDGYCCNSACTLGCQACDVAGAPGTCTNLTGLPHGARTCSGFLCAATSAPSCPSSCNATTNGDAECATGYFCNGSPGVCAAKKASGQTCVSGAHECANGICVDGYCCNAACGSQCQACDVSGAQGTCSNVTGTPHGARAACASGLVCQGASVSCPATCTTDAGCASGYFCSGSACVAKKTNGATCSTGGHECSSNNCVDGYCCNAPCNGECEACDVGGNAGTCVAVSGPPHGARTACGGSGACKAQCDGSNRTACGAYPGISTVCAAASCSSNSGTSTRYCDGTGSCTAASSTPCAPYVCNGTTACKTSCGSDLDCGSGYHCSGTTCVTNGALGTYCTGGSQCAGGTFCTNNACCNVATCAGGLVCNANGLGTCSKPPGAACGGSAECGSGFCVDGVCCNSACSGQCEACNVGGSPGSCVAVAGVPRNGRTACAGTGACQAACDGSNRTSCGPFPGISTVCAAAACTGGSATPTRSCDGLGACAAAAASTCAPYVCSGTSCKASCSGDGDCVAGDFCASTSCTPRLASGLACTGSNQCASGNCVDGVCCSSAGCAAPLKCNVVGAAGTCSKPIGAACGGNAECGGGRCVDGFCCNSACAGQCEACDVSGSEGSCTTVAGPPHGARTACNGVGACRATCDGSVRTTCGAPPGPSTICAAPSCAAGKASGTSSCDGVGGCAAPTPIDCGAYQCGATACKASCGTTTADCATGYACKAGVCVTTGDLGTICTDDTQCKSGHCTSAGGGKSVCCGSATCPTSAVCADTTTSTPGACVKLAGQSCSTSSDCATGFCVDAVCCDSLCAGQCEACDVAGAPGKCTPVSGAPKGTRAACDAGGTDVCKALACDGGKDRTKCVGFANGPAKECKPASCADGTATEAAYCDGVGTCKDGATKTCGSYACGTTACVGKCAGDTDCATGFACDTATTKCVPAKPTCTADGLSSTSPDGKSTTPCAPFRCDTSSGSCYPKCTTTDQCAPGQSCDGTTCAPAAAGTQGSGGCDVGSAPGGRGGLAVALGIAALALGRLRRRRAA